MSPRWFRGKRESLGRDRRRRRVHCEGTDYQLNARRPGRLGGEMSLRHSLHALTRLFHPLLHRGAK
jgi:hypothetical protein